LFLIPLIPDALAASAGDSNSWSINNNLPRLPLRFLYARDLCRLCLLGLG
jgi:hypothetical protein